jgi:hypothetical protein
MIRISYPNSCVLWIDEVNNQILKSRFNNYASTKTNIQRLFHGTNEQSMRSIVENGFCSKYNKTSAYGMGTYFAKNAIYSKNYAPSRKDEISFMLVCDVVIGKSCNGSFQKKLDILEYDSMVDNLNEPKIFVVPNDDAAYPAYVIAFHKNAK